MSVEDRAEERAPRSASATIRIDLQRPRGEVDPRIFGHFLESNFFGNIEGGVLDESSPHSIVSDGAEHGLRSDVIEACRQLGLPVVRWPGGNFASGYHWQDGVGPRAARPRRIDLAWGGEETNRFGTEEFLAWCSLVGTEPYLVNACRDLEESVRWVEYTNHRGDTEMSRLRAGSGHPQPHAVRLWGIGNEVYGPWQVGHRGPEAYALAARQHAQFMRVVDPDLQLVVAGAPWDQERWTRPLMDKAGELVDYFSLHLYGASTHLAGHDDYDAVVSQPVYFEKEIAGYSGLLAALAEELGVERRLSLALDEWNIRHLEPISWPEPSPGDDGGIAARPTPDPGSATGGYRVNRWSPRTLADSLFYAGVFHALHRLSGLSVAPRMANTVNLVNANGLLAVRPGGLVKAASYHVWDLYQNHLGHVSLPVEVAGPTRFEAVRQGADPDASGAFATITAEVPFLDVIACTDERRASLQVVVINRDRVNPIRALLVTDESGARSVLSRRAHVFSMGTGTKDVFAANSFKAPFAVCVSDEGTVELEQGHWVFPPHSISLLAFDP